MEAQLLQPAASGVRTGNWIDDAYDAWKAADAAARVLQCEVSDTWYRFDAGAGEPPSSEMLRNAAWLRHAAGQKLARAIELLHQHGAIQPAAPRRARASTRMCGISSSQSA